ncbi:hypothetical protein [Sorangium sp. So ce1335]|uniref:hypothetical protein n=1 Tax=Sorangium sp. So ce1335 TaxID=3133335 RepID=UPI003F62F0E7
MMRHGSWTAGILAALLCTVAMESIADACSPPLPGLTGTLPESGGALPGNAAIFFDGFSISLDAVSVTVDGEPASLVAVKDLPPLGYSLVARIEPPPGEGQAIVIEGDFCGAQEPCGQSRIELTAGAADTEAPAGPSGLSFDLHDHADFTSSGGDCQVDSDLTWWVTVEAETAGSGEAPVITTVEAFRDDTFTDPVFSQSRFMNATPVTVALSRTVDVLGGAAAPEAFCFRATVTDTAGNAAGAPVHACKPCYHRKDPDTAQPGLGGPPEPAWTEEDVYPGGTCDSGMGPGSGGTGGSGPGSGGSGPGSGGSGPGTGAGGSGPGAGGSDGGGETEESGCSFRAAGASGGAGRAGIAALALLVCAALAGRKKR